MTYRVLADLVLVLHLLFIAFVVGGGYLVLRWRWAPLVHLPAACWGVFVEASGRACPLTPLENSLREAAGGSGYSGGFIEHYLVPLIYPAHLSRSLQLSLAAFVIVVNALAYAAIWRHKVARRLTRRCN